MKRSLIRPTTTSSLVLLLAAFVVPAATPPGRAATEQLFAGGNERIVRPDGEADVRGKAGSGRTPHDIAEGTIRPAQPARRGRDHVARESRPERRASEVASGHQLMAGVGEDVAGGDSKEEPVAERVLAAAAPQSSRGRYGFPQASHRRDQEAGRTRSDTVRLGLRPSGASSPRVSSADLSDDPHRPW